MKYILTLAFALLCLTACEKDENQYKYDNSLKQWNIYKASVNNRYYYTAVSGSFTGLSTETKIIVDGGVVASRSFRSYTYGNGGTITTIAEWTETKASLNTHQGGEATLTLDEVYTKARNLWLAADSKTNKIYFETDANGLISTCGYVPNGCQDDCFTGIRIKEIKGL